MIRHEVITPAGFYVGVPESIWHAWPSGHRRMISVSEAENDRLDEQQKRYDAEKIHFLQSGKSHD